MVKIFATGATGFIGGDAIIHIHQTHPEYEITVLVRSEEKGKTVSSQFSDLKLVYGDLDSIDVIREEAAKADIVANFADADHAPSLEAIIAGLQSREPSLPRYLIHTSGTGLLLYNDIAALTAGIHRSKVYSDDDEHIAEITVEMPDAAPHRLTDKLVLAAGADGVSAIKTAIVAPPTIYGEGRGPDKKHSHQIPELARVTLERGKGWTVEKGEAEWHNVHVRDLSNLFLLLVEDAVAGAPKADWGAKGYYFCENGTHVWKDASAWVVASAVKRGLIESEEVESVKFEEAMQLTPFGGAVLGMNSKGKAVRAREKLGWEAKEKGLKETIDEEVRRTAERLGKTKA